MNYLKIVILLSFLFIGGCGNSDENVNSNSYLLIKNLKTANVISDTSRKCDYGNSKFNEFKRLVGRKIANRLSCLNEVKYNLNSNYINLSNEFVIKLN